MPVEKSTNGVEVKNKESWLLDDDDLGKNFFDAGEWAHAHGGKEGSDLDNYIEDIKAGARVAIDQSIGILTPLVLFQHAPVLLSNHPS